MLAAYLAETAMRRWQIGTLDCCTFMADWLLRLGLPDPMADRRGRYVSRVEYRRLIKSEGGLLKSCDRRFSSIGLSSIQAPSAGAVAVVQAPFAVRRGQILSRPIGAICVSATQRAIVTPDAGLLIAELPTQAMWSVNA